MKKQTANTNLSSFNYKTLGSYVAAGLLLFGAASCSQDRGNQENAVANEQEYEEDVTVDGTQNTEQVTNTDADLFNQYDRNTDQQWDQEEFNTGMGSSTTYTDWDTDRDGSLNENEYTTGMQNWQSQNAGTQGTTTGTASGTENATGTTSNMGTFSDWDANGDGSIDREEFNSGTFKAWDTNQDGNLSNDEYNMYNRGAGTSTNTGTDTNMGTGTNTGTGTDTETNTGSGSGETGTTTGTGTNETGGGQQ